MKHIPGLYHQLQFKSAQELHVVSRHLLVVKPGDNLTAGKASQLAGTMATTHREPYVIRAPLLPYDTPVDLVFTLSDELVQLRYARHTLDAAISSFSDTPLFLLIRGVELQCQRQNYHIASQAMQNLRLRLNPVVQLFEDSLLTHPDLKLTEQFVAHYVFPPRHHDALIDTAATTAYTEVRVKETHDLFLTALEAEAIDVKEVGFILDDRLDYQVLYKLMPRTPDVNMVDLKVWVKQQFPAFSLLDFSVKHRWLRLAGPVDHKAASYVRRVRHGRKPADPLGLERALYARIATFRMWQRVIDKRELFDPIFTPNPTVLPFYTFSGIIFNPSITSHTTPPHPLAMDLETSVQFMTRYTTMLPGRPFQESTYLQLPPSLDWFRQQRRERMVAFRYRALARNDGIRGILQEFEATMQDLLSMSFRGGPRRFLPDAVLESQLARRESIQTWKDEQTRHGRSVLEIVTSALDVATRIRRQQQALLELLVKQTLNIVEEIWNQAAQLHLIYYWLEWHAADGRAEEARRTEALRNAFHIIQLRITQPELLRQTLRPIDAAQQFPTRLGQVLVKQHKTTLKNIQLQQKQDWRHLENDIASRAIALNTKGREITQELEQFRTPSQPSPQSLVRTFDVILPRTLNYIAERNRMQADIKHRDTLLDAIQTPMPQEASDDIKKRLVDALPLAQRGFLIIHHALTHPPSFYISTNKEDADNSVS